MTVVIEPVSPSRAADLIAAMGTVRVAVVGDVMLDRYLLGDAERISPEAPVPVVTVEHEQAAPGGAANVASNISAAGAKPALVGIIGDDDAGAALLEALRAAAIPVDGLVTVPGRPTTSKTRIIARGQQVVRIDREITNTPAARFRDLVLSAALSAIGTADVLLIEDYDKGCLDVAMAGELIAAARSRAIPVVVDPKQRHFFAYSGATVLKPNRRELEAAFATHFMGDDADLDSARQRSGAEHLLLTLGAAGIALVSAGMPVRTSASNARDVFDVSGAGDTVAAWLALAIAAGAQMTEAAWIANVAAGIEVGKRGTATVSPTELLSQIDDTAQRM